MSRVVHRAVLSAVLITGALAPGTAARAQQSPAPSPTSQPPLTATPPTPLGQASVTPTPTASATATPTPTPTATATPGDEGTAAPEATGGGPSLANTGSDAGLLALAGASLLGMGLSLRRLVELDGAG